MSGLVCFGMSVMFMKCVLLCVYVVYVVCVCVFVTVCVCTCMCEILDIVYMLPLT